jgi:hypothetical protein
MVRVQLHTVLVHELWGIELFLRLNFERNPIQCEFPNFRHQEDYFLLYQSYFESIRAKALLFARQRRQLHEFL